mgnify:CR=1 FL=1
MVLLRKQYDFNLKCSSRIALGPILGLPSTSLGLFLAQAGSQPAIEMRSKLL